MKKVECYIYPAIFTCEPGKEVLKELGLERDEFLEKAVELMGHSDEKMIMGVYAHLDEAKENTKEKINSVISL